MTKVLDSRPADFQGFSAGLTESVGAHRLVADDRVPELGYFQPGADWSLLDHVRMKRELEALTGREVDLMTRRALERSHNRLLREHILSGTRTLYPDEKALDVAG